jgi:hypothetical protein
MRETQICSVFYEATQWYKMFGCPKPNKRKGLCEKGRYVMSGNKSYQKQLTYRTDRKLGHMTLGHPSTCYSISNISAKFEKYFYATLNVSKL